MNRNLIFTMTLLEAVGFLEIVKFHLGVPTLSPFLAADYNVRDNMRFPSTTVVFYTKGFRNVETIFRKGQRLI